MSNYEKGLEVRRAVLGDAYVDRALEGMDEFSRPIQEFATEYCWGRIWSQDGVLDRRSRSILNIGMLVALNRRDELKLHIAGAFRNGLSVAEVGGLLLQTAVYCGLPAGLEAFRVAREVMNEMELN